MLTTFLMRRISKRKMLAVRITSKDDEQLKAWARRARMPLADFVRDMIAAERTRRESIASGIVGTAAV